MTFEGKAGTFIAEQGELIENVAKRAKIKIPFGCKQARCKSCEVRLNGRGTI